MIIKLPNPSQVSLQIVARELDGSPRTSLTSANVRVYHMVGSTETDVLVFEPLVQVGTTNTWRYVWEPTSLAIGQYVVEYTLVDDDAVMWVGTEDLTVNDFAQETTLAALGVDIEIIRKVETGRWKMVDDQMIFYDDNGTTPLFTFNLFDLAGNPSMDNVFERVLVV